MLMIKTFPSDFSVDKRKHKQSVSLTAGESRRRCATAFPGRTECTGVCRPWANLSAACGVDVTIPKHIPPHGVCEKDALMGAMGVKEVMLCVRWRERKGRGGGG